MTSVFPASYSTLSGEALAVLVKERYGLHATTATLLVRGVGDTYLVVAAEAKFILRIYRSTHRSFEQVNEEVQVLLALNQAAVSVSYPVADIDGNTIQRINAIEGERCAVLFTFADGEPLKLFNEQQMLNLGLEMARFHNVSAQLATADTRWYFDISTTLEAPFKMISPALKKDPENYEWLTKTIAQVKSKLQETNTVNFPVGYCHYDFLPKNFHFKDDAVTFFDFDFMGRGWLVNDIMTFWQHLALDVYTGRMKQEAADEAYSNFLKGYRELRTITDEELNLVPYLSIGFWLFYMGFHTTHDQFYAFAQPSHVRVYVGVMKHIVNNYWKQI
ncbi:MAG: phosphotransferase [Flavitalea sp.]